MNRDVKIGLAIGLLLLVGLFVWFAWRQSTRPAVDDLALKEGVGPDKTSSGTGTPDAAAGQYFPGDCATTPAGTGADTASVTMGTPAAPGSAKSDLTPEADKYRAMLNNTTPTGPAVVTPTPPAPPVSSVAGAPTSYVVKPGDSLSTISRKVYGSARFWQKIAEANNIADARSIRNGQTLKIPALTDSERGRVSGPAVASIGTVTPGERRYTVRQGDTLDGISRKYYGTPKHVALLREANRLDNDRMLRVGSTLVIPALPSTVPTAPGLQTPVTPAAVATIPTSVTAPAGREYTVREGDTLHMISKKFYGTTKYYLLIMQANNLEDTRAMRIGSKLVIPPRPDVSAVVPVVATTETVAMESSLAPGERRYTVREGDSFPIIAATELGSSLYSPDVMKRNKLTEADNLRPGQVLVIPARDTLHTLSSVTE